MRPPGLDDEHVEKSGHSNDWRGQFLAQERGKRTLKPISGGATIVDAGSTMKLCGQWGRHLASSTRAASTGPANGLAELRQL